MTRQAPFPSQSKRNSGVSESYSGLKIKAINVSCPILALARLLKGILNEYSN